MDKRPAPRLNDPAELAAYRHELRGVAPVMRYTGVALAVLGAVMLVGWRHVWGGPLWLPVTVVVIAFTLMAVTVARRTRYHRARMRGEG